MREIKDSGNLVVHDCHPASAPLTIAVTTPDVTDFPMACTLGKGSDSRSVGDGGLPTLARWADAAVSRWLERQQARSQPIPSWWPTVTSWVSRIKVFAIVTIQLALAVPLVTSP